MHIAMSKNEPTGVGRGDKSARLDARRRGQDCDRVEAGKSNAAAETARALLSATPSTMTCAEEAVIDGLMADDPPIAGAEFGYEISVAMTAAAYGAKPVANGFVFHDGSAIVVTEPRGQSRMWLRRAWTTSSDAGGTILIERKPDLDAALEIVRRYVASFKDHRGPHVANGAHYATSDPKRLATLAVKLGAELLIDNGLINGSVPWRKEAEQHHGVLPGLQPRCLPAVRAAEDKE